MSLERREHPEAGAELREVANWHDDRAHGLGEDFYDAIDRAIARIHDWPRSASMLDGWVGPPELRAMTVDIFPFRVIYYLTDTSLVVLAYAHGRRKPAYWQHRLDG